MVEERGGEAHGAVGDGALVAQRVAAEERYGPAGPEQHCEGAAEGDEHHGARA